MIDGQINDLIRISLASILAALVTHGLMVLRVKKSTLQKYSKEKLHLFYAPLLIQSDLLKSEIESWEQVLESGEEKSYNDNEMRLRGQVISHHCNNMVEIKSDITSLISKNYGLINEKDEDMMNSFIRSMQKISIMKLDIGFYIFGDKSNSHQFDELKKAIDTLHKDLKPTIRRLKFDAQPISYYRRMLHWVCACINYVFRKK